MLWFMTSGSLRVSVYSVCLCSVICLKSMRECAVVCLCMYYSWMLFSYYIYNFGRKAPEYIGMIWVCLIPVFDAEEAIGSCRRGSVVICAMWHHYKSVHSREARHEHALLVGMALYYILCMCVGRPGACVLCIFSQCALESSVIGPFSHVSF